MPSPEESKGQQKSLPLRKSVKRTCNVAGCKNGVVQGGVCISHGAKRRKCRFPGCDKNSKCAGLCSRHGPPRKKCEHEGCFNVSVQGESQLSLIQSQCLRHKTTNLQSTIHSTFYTVPLAGKCKGHAPEAKICSVPGCPNNTASIRSSLCKQHRDAQREDVTVEESNAPKPGEQPALPSLFGAGAFGQSSTSGENLTLAQNQALLQNALAQNAMATNMFMGNLGASANYMNAMAMNAAMMNPYAFNPMMAAAMNPMMAASMGMGGMLGPQVGLGSPIGEPGLGAGAFGKPSVEEKNDTLQQAALNESADDTKPPALPSVENEAEKSEEVNPNEW